VYQRELQAILLIVSAAGCSRGSASSQRETAASHKVSVESTGCRVLTAADIKGITGVDVHPIGRGALPGAGGTCGNYASTESDAYLGVNALQTAAEYDMAVAAVPHDIYPKRLPVAGLGDQAVLMKDETGLLRYLVARKGNHGAVLFPLGGGLQEISDDQLRQLAERAITAR
jgi:hypothetical protein